MANSTDAAAAALSATPADERLRRQTGLRRLMARPELGALAGTVLVFAFFGVTASGTGMFAADGVLNWTTVSAQLAIIGVGAALLMIGGEFDLSVGSMIGFAGMMIAIPSVYFGWPVAASVLFAFAGALLIGYLNGIIVVKTKLPSFIVTLASLFILRGLTIALSIMFTNRTIVSGVRDAAEGSFVAWLFGGKIGAPVFVWLADAGVIGRLPNGAPGVNGIPMVIVAAVFIAYSFGGPYMPEVLQHKGASLTKFLNHQWLVTEGVFGVALGVSTSFVFLFVLFGTLLE